MKAYLVIRDNPHYRQEAFAAGLAAAGYHVDKRLPSAPPGPGDILLIWNRYSCNEQTADKWEGEGGTVIVAENGYCGRDAAGRQHYALAIHGHNGSGTWPYPEGGPGAERWRALGIELAPWRQDGDHILVCPNRHFGMKGLAMPYNWQLGVLKELRGRTKRPVRVRPHPQNSAPARTLAEDMAGAWAVVIWASSAGVHALIAGIPVIAFSPWWICKPAAASFEDIEAGNLPDRLPVFQRLAWAQWRVDEIANGTPFRLLLPPARQA